MSLERSCPLAPYTITAPTAMASSSPHLILIFHLGSVIFLFLLLLNPQSAYGKEDMSEETSISCYSCNSAYDPRCGDPFDDYSIGKVNCSLLPRREHIPKEKPTFCRKNVIEVYGKVRVVRGCGYLIDDSEMSSCVRRAGTHDVSVIYCACRGSECNSSHMTAATGWVTTLIAVSGILAATFISVDRHLVL